ncbi:conserved hypothetical protein [Thermoplasma acidophilum]|uniref:Uncharacterized protein n=1 Tax=Thermoplasma acidophilum (strain ATCC 25905 / DSM 1728 / JCM 9062 / NBRC 15155 / AMRC-C165) TaxID=273075 RepID=Q9HL94_THEAC|nr:DUF6015 family protein [Thermoplasma acidophilum]CAC11480.1 conserved hypothetical protein [Thermoplasma acidophilum]
MAIVTREKLLQALDNIYGKKGMSRPDVEDLSDFVLSFFGYDDYVLDNVLSPAERDVFYNLEEYGILETYREEISILHGKVWRVNQWRYRKDKIEELASATTERKNETNIYDEIFREM